jgi:DNA-directed DNA polymerase III PolC
MFAPLHTKSDYSPGYGTASVEDLLSRARGYGYSAIGLTDVENLYGQVRFHKAARAYGIKPITGVELRSGYGPGELGHKQGRLILLGRDRAGYESLCRIITRRRRYSPSVDDSPLSCLEAQPRSLFYLSDDPLVLNELLRAGVASSDIRFLLVRPGGAAAPAGIPVVADTDVVMAEPADWNLHVLQVAIRKKQKTFEVTEAESPDRSLADPATLRRLYHDVPEALAESMRVAEACNFDLTDLQPPSPLENIGGETADDRLDRLSRQRFQAGRQANRWQDPIYERRLETELATLRRLQFSSYFLIAAEVIDQARREGIAIAGRGSAASSLVAHVLGITDVDPIKHGLLFERFIHSERRDFPDIDLDLPSDRRDELIDWVFQRFGPEKVAMVSAHQTYGRRAAFRAGLKALGMSADAVAQFCERIPEDDLEPISPLPIHVLPDQVRASAPLINRLIGKLQHISVHPGGFVLAQPRIDQYAPLERAPKGVVITQYDLRSLKEIGLVKIDLLGNRALSAIQETLRVIGRPIDMPDRDLETLTTLREGKTIGCFQIETPAMRSVLKKLPVRGLTDLIAALAIVRPGPASGAAKVAYIRRANGDEPPQPPHPRLAERLRETYGMMLFEEDLMSAIAAMTHWPLEKADELRTAILSAQDAPATLAKLEGLFCEASVKTGVTAGEAAAVWKILERFAAYSFNKAHAASYAHIAWQTAYLKTHFPAPFACAVLNHYGGHYPLRTMAADFARQGVRLLPPHVNFSQAPCVVDGDDVRIGLSAIKYLSTKSRTLILERRPYLDLSDLLEKVPLQRRELEALVLSGACDDLWPLAIDAYPIAHEDLLALFKKQSHPRMLEGFALRRPYGARKDTYCALVRIRNELHYLNMHPSHHPMQVLRSEAEREGCISTAELPARVGQIVRIAALVASTRRLVTGGGQVMQFVTFEDESGLVEAVLFPTIYRTLDDPVKNPGPYLIAGRVAEDHGDIHLIVSDVMPFHRRSRPYGKDSERLAGSPSEI